MLNSLAELPELESELPVMFIGHGSPMNAIDDNTFVRAMKSMGKELPPVKAILCISAHWETRGIQVLSSSRPRTIHDFSGFPKELYQFQYPAPGHPKLALEIADILMPNQARTTENWGFDHGTWSILTHLFHSASVPVVQLSLDQNRNLSEHYQLAKSLRVLRKKGVLILGSGNLVHNLGLVAWDKLAQDSYSYDWAKEASIMLKKWIQEQDNINLSDAARWSAPIRLAIPSFEHFLPALYPLACMNQNERINFFNDEIVGGSISMTSFISRLT